MSKKYYGVLLDKRKANGKLIRACSLLNIPSFRKAVRLAEATAWFAGMDRGSTLKNTVLHPNNANSYTSALSSERYRFPCNKGKELIEIKFISYERRLKE